MRVATCNVLPDCWRDFLSLSSLNFIVAVAVAVVATMRQLFWYFLLNFFAPPFRRWWWQWVDGSGNVGDHRDDVDVNVDFVADFYCCLPAWQMAGNCVQHLCRVIKLPERKGKVQKKVDFILIIIALNANVVRKRIIHKLNGTSARMQLRVLLKPESSARVTEKEREVEKERERACFDWATHVVFN